MTEEQAKKAVEEFLTTMCRNWHKNGFSNENIIRLLNAIVDETSEELWDNMDDEQRERAVKRLTNEQLDHLIEIKTRKFD